MAFAARRRQPQQIIGGLTAEVIDRLTTRGAIMKMPDHLRGRYRFNSAELALELDKLVRAHRIRPFLAARAAAAVREERQVKAVIIEDKSGRRALRASQFIDASGDGDLLRAAGFAAQRENVLQPVSLQALVSGLAQLQLKFPAAMIWPRVKERALALGYPIANSNPWLNDYPGVGDVTNIYGPRLSGIDASDADQRTEAILAGRRYLGILIEAIRHEFQEPVGLVAWAHALGVRQTWQVQGEHRLTGAELLRGEVFPDTIGHGTYPMDIHHPGGTLLRYLDGREEIVNPDGSKHWNRWRAEGTPSPACYHLPYRSLQPREADNLLVAGRLLDADREAFGGVRVMVNMNQTGEAVGVAAALALQAGSTIGAVDPVVLRAALNAGGSLL